MGKIVAATLAAIFAVLVIVLMAFVWYRRGWSAFQYVGGDNPSWAPASGADLSRLRFRNAVFTVVRGDGVTRYADVTTVLNGMAAAYAGGSAAAPPALVLDRPLNAFSFVIPGFNDSATVADPSAGVWCSAPPAACAADADCPGASAGACSCSVGGKCPPGVTGTCFSCPGGAKVTLTGKWRTV